MEYITGEQCKNSSLHILPAQKKGEMGAESETAKEEGRELQQVRIITNWSGSLQKNCESQQQFKEDKTMGLTAEGYKRLDNIDLTSVVEELPRLKLVEKVPRAATPTLAFEPVI